MADELQTSKSNISAKKIETPHNTNTSTSQKDPEQGSKKKSKHNSKQKQLVDDTKAKVDKSKSRSKVLIFGVIITFIFLCCCVVLVGVVLVVIERQARLDGYYRSSKSMQDSTDDLNDTNTKENSDQSSLEAGLVNVNFDIAMGNSKLFKVFPDKKYEELKLGDFKVHSYEFYPELKKLMFTTYELEPKNKINYPTELYLYDFVGNNLTKLVTRHENFGKFAIEEMETPDYPVFAFGLSPNGEYFYHDQCGLKIYDISNQQVVLDSFTPFHENCEPIFNEAFEFPVWSDKSNLLVVNTGGGGGWMAGRVYKYEDSDFTELQNIPENMALKYDSGMEGSIYNYVGGFTEKGLLVYTNETTAEPVKFVSRIRHLDLETGEIVDIHKNTVQQQKFSYPYFNMFSTRISDQLYIKREADRYELGEINLNNYEAKVVGPIPEKNYQDALRIDTLAGADGLGVLIEEVLKTDLDREKFGGSKRKLGFYRINDKKYYKLYSLLDQENCGGSSRIRYQYLKRSNAVLAYCSPTWISGDVDIGQLLFLDDMRTITLH